MRLTGMAVATGMLLGLAPGCQSYEFNQVRGESRLVSATWVRGCVWALDPPPSDARAVQVLVDGVSVPVDQPDTWTWSGGNVTFVGALCTRLETATVDAPVKLEFRIDEPR